MNGFGVSLNHHGTNRLTAMLDKEPYMSGKIVFWRSLGVNMGFFKRFDTPQGGGEYWKSQGYVPVTSERHGQRWADPNDLYSPADAFKRWGNEINPLMAIFTEAKESVLNAIAKYVWNTPEKKVKLNIGVTEYDEDNDILIYRHYTSIYLDPYICLVEYEESAKSDDEYIVPDTKTEPIEDMSLDKLFEIINFITEQNYGNEH